MRVDIKPLSVNRAWQGKRYKTDAYKRYERDLMLILPSLHVPKGKLELHLTFGFSSKNSDFDNPVKPFVDCLQKKYGFNDKLIKRSVIEVEEVKKGGEYVEFEIKEY
jgi:Holliday junction resolvase RusA-like endonuclease